MTKKRNHDWEGMTEMLGLYQFWTRVVKEADGITIQEYVSQSADDILNLSISSDNNKDALLLSDERPSTTSDTIDKAALPDPVTSGADPCKYSNQDDDLRKMNSPLTPTGRDNVKRNILVTPKRSAADIFKDVVTWPQNSQSLSKKRKKEPTPSVVTSDKWVEYYEEKENIKQEIERKKEERRKTLAIKKAQKESQKQINVDKIQDKNRKRKKGFFK